MPATGPDERKSQYVSPRCLRSRRDAGWVKWLRTEGDTDGDGLVSRTEWNKGKQGWEWLFPTIDTNKDGQIDAKE